MLTSIPLHRDITGHRGRRSVILTWSCMSRVLRNAVESDDVSRDIYHLILNGAVMSGVRLLVDNANIYLCTGELSRPEHG